MGIFDKFKNAFGLEKENSPSKNQENNDSINSNKIHEKEMESNQENNSLENNFKYLDNLIHGNSDEIILNTDILLQDNEEFKYSEGIFITDGNLIIDGKNHFIDAKSKVPILKINGGKITFRNIIFKNGFHEHSKYIEEYNSGGAINNNGADLVFENCHFLNNQKIGYSSAAGAIYNSNGSITFKNCNFKDNSAEEGGAIYNIRSTLKVLNCNFENNSANEGGAIYIVSGTLTASDCTFSNNTSKHVRKYDNDVGGGGAIAHYNKYNALTNEKTYSTFNNCIFESNSAEEFGGAILNEKECSLECIDCTFKDNIASTASAIFTREQLNIFNSNFINNKSDFAAVISQEDFDSSSTIQNCSFEGNHANYGMIFIHYGFSYIKNSTFKNNTSEEGYEIYNQKGSIQIEKTNFNTNHKTIYNNHILKINKEDNLENNIMETSSSVLNYNYQKIDSSSKNFTFLNNLIQQESNEIHLDCDILMENNEQNFYEGGIELYQDNLILDGQGHIIDANNLSRIFYVTGKNITLKNIKFKNGNYFANFLDIDGNGGGAIYALHNTSLTIIDCEFINNHSRRSGGVISSKGELKLIEKTKFENNSSRDNGGAIYNINNLIIKDCQFKNNTSKYGKGGAIHSIENLKINKTNFKNNKSIFGGAINFDDGNSCLEDCYFKSNHAEMMGGSIYNTQGSLELNNCNFDENSAHTAGAIDSSSRLKLNKCNFIRNQAENECGAINTSESGEFIKCIFKYNDLTIDNIIVKNNGCGSIRNSGSLIIDTCEFTGQREEIIQNLKELTIESCEFGFNHFINNKGVVYLEDMVLDIPIIK